MDRHVAAVEAVAAITRKARRARKVVFVSGNFNVVHPGHLRLLNFAAECGDFLVVGVIEDGASDAVVPEQLRLEAVKAIGIVDYAFILRMPPEQFITLLKPAIVVKGKEHEALENPERKAVESCGGTLLFSSGEVKFSSLDLLQRELVETNFSTIKKPVDYLQRHSFSMGDLIGLVREFSKLKIVVIGDLIVDEYVNCQPLGMSQEDPTIVVTPIRTHRFVGGAGIVAAHACSLGAEVTYLYVSGDDTINQFAREMLDRFGVVSDSVVDTSRPTTLKQRFRSQDKTLLRVSHLRQHDIPNEVGIAFLEKAFRALERADLLIFSDFNYGCLPQDVLERLIAFCQERNIMMVADSQSSSQVGDVSRFHGMRLLTPTEREARLAVRDFSSGLVVLAESLHKKANARQIILTLGNEGLLVHAPDRNGDDFVTDRLPAFNTAPKDVAGAGDSLLTCASMTLAVGGNIWQSAYLGSVAAACQVGRVGNTPLTSRDLITELSL
ncbi:MAG: adenylyltransferase/cytidyltransferase family protein [Betaproteobacteria bacterium]|nr:adenylyltransferase/cytidyltransferase family protein [Betaproteobacteria bacterium]